MSASGRAERPAEIGPAVAGRRRTNFLFRSQTLRPISASPWRGPRRVERPCSAAAPLRAGVAMEFAGRIGAGRDGKPQPWFSQGDPPASRLHLAFNARSRAEVGAFHAAALAAGARDNGALGLRPHCHPNY
jgi:hypothetical protein